MSIRLFYATQVVAIFNMLYLSYAHYSLKFGSMAKSVCNINDFLNCDVVNTSSYSLFLNIPVGLWGFFLNIVLLTFGFKGLWSGTDLKFKDRNLSIAILIASISFVASIIMAWISFVVIGAMCLFCTLAYVLSLISLILLLLNKPFKISKIINKLELNSKLLIRYAVIFVCIISSVFLINDIVKKSMLGQNIKLAKFALTTWQSARVYNFKTQNALKLTSADDPKMTIVEFADFKCIHCKNASGSLKNFVHSKKDVNFIFMPYPLDGVCNESIPTSGDGASCKFAYATYCADQQALGWKMHDYLFDNFGKVTVSDLETTDFGLDMVSFNDCMNSTTTHEAIMAFAKQGDRAGIRGTPSIFVNGKKLENGQNWYLLDKVYESL